MTIPFEPIILGYKFNIHLIFEYLAFFISYRYYVFVKKHSVDSIPILNRLSIPLFLRRFRCGHLHQPGLQPGATGRPFRASRYCQDALRGGPEIAAAAQAHPRPAHFDGQ